MAAIPVTISGVLFDKLARTQQNVVLIGAASRTGLGVGGGPIIPDTPVELPPGIWPDPPEGQAPHPEHPIVIPPPPGVDGPPIEAVTIWTPDTGWAVIFVPTGEHVTPSK